MKNNKEEINKLCKKCINDCKQDKKVKLLNCPNFKFKAQQLTLKFKRKRKNK